MTGWLVFAFFVVLITLRAVALPEARIAGGAVVMAFGIWMIWATAVHSYGFSWHGHGAHDLLPLFFGVWLVVRGALRFASY